MGVLDWMWAVAGRAALWVSLKVQDRQQRQIKNLRGEVARLRAEVHQLRARSKP